MPAHRGAFIQFACSAGETVNDDLFIRHLLRNIAQENLPVTALFQQIADKVYSQRNDTQRPLSIDGLSNGRSIYLNKVNTCTYTITARSSICLFKNLGFQFLKEYLSQ